MIDFKALHELADFGKVLEREIAFSVPVKSLETLINLMLAHVGADSLSGLPELVLVHITYLIVFTKEAEHVRERAMFHLQSLP